MCVLIDPDNLLFTCVYVCMYVCVWVCGTVHEVVLNSAYILHVLRLFCCAFV